MMRAIYTIIVLLVFHQIAVSQSQWNIRAGFGITNFSHVEVSRHFNMILKPGIALGYFPYSDGGITTASLSNTFSISRSKKYHDATTGFTKIQLNYFSEKNESNIHWKWATTELMLGRNFNITNQFGISGELGGFITLFQEKTREEEYLEDEEDNAFPNAFFNARLQLFFRF